jgi:transposase
MPQIIVGCDLSRAFIDVCINAGRTTSRIENINVLDGMVIAQNMQRHRHQEFIRFLNRIEREVPPGKAIHVILDNYAAHKKDKVRAWLDRHPRWTFHFVPTSCSWLNAVEGFFAKLTRRRLKHGVFAIISLCPFAKAQIDRHPEWQDMVRRSKT